MRVVSVNVGIPREIIWKNMSVVTGIFKDPVDGPVMIRELNLDGDQQADLSVHGGPLKAVYGYASEHYEYWKDKLPDVTFSWGQFGENLTTEGLLESDLYIGDVLQVGSATLKVTQPRLPCYKLQVRFNRDDMIKRFLVSRRSGFYFSVVQEGEVSADSKLEFLSRDPHRVTVQRMSRLALGEE
jgi:MOSC domain-containing protein YiiM